MGAELLYQAGKAGTKISQLGELCRTEEGGILGSSGMFYVFCLKACLFAFVCLFVNECVVV